MHTISKVVIGIGIIAIIIGIIMLASGDSIEENMKEGIIYQGTDGSVTITEIKSNSESVYYVHLVDKTYDGGSQGGYNERHYNNTWNLTEENCNIVKAFSIKDNDNNEMFYPKCNYVEDGTEDHYIVVGHLCNKRNAWTDKEGMTHLSWSGNGCPGGTFNFETNGNEIMVYDVGALLAVGIEWLIKWLGSLLACCCGSIILLIGIALAFTMDDSKEPAINATTNAVNSYQQNVPEKKGASSWDEQEDYIHKSDDKTNSDFERADKDGDGKIDKKEFADMMKSGMAISKDEKEKPKEKKKNGQYDIPPPPEY